MSPRLICAEEIVEIGPYGVGGLNDDKPQPMRS